MTAFPLLFGFRDRILGHGFVAGVEVDGRVLLREETDGFWMDGVNPGDVAAGGPDRASAFTAFRREYTALLFDLAAEAPTFDDFRAAVERLVWDADQAVAAEWTALVVETQKGRLRLADLPTVPAATRPPAVRVVRIEVAQDTVRLNRLDEPIAEAA